VYKSKSIETQYQYIYSNKFATIYLEYENGNHYNSLITKKEKVIINLKPTRTMKKSFIMIIMKKRITKTIKIFSKEI